MSYASYRLTLILDEVLRYAPDLIVLATGHNEFLEDRTCASLKHRPPWVSWLLEKAQALRTLRLASRFHGSPERPPDTRNAASARSPDVAARLDNPSGYASDQRDAQWRREVIEGYRRSVRDMMEKCRRTGVPLILVNLGENVRDCPPFKSQHRLGLPASALQHWQELFDRAMTLDEVSPEAALRVYRNAEAIDDQYALLLYRMARCFDRMGQMKQAARYYAQAKQQDVCPLRMLDARQKHRHPRCLPG